MRDDRFKRLQAVFAEALTLDPELRESYVRRVCSDDSALAEEALELLEHEARVGDARTIRPAAEALAAFEAAELRTLIGREIGRYRLEAEIASGGMGRVFKARRTDGEVEQIVALKLIREELFDPALLERFSMERRILAALNHPGIAHLIDAGADERGTPFVAMEYVDGLPLLEYCAAKSLSVRERVRLFRQVLAAVSYAHRNLIVHRDLKPDNILVTPEGKTKLLDFGIAKALKDSGRKTATAHRFFTLAYAAPEQLSKRDVDTTCDVYALGAILYTLLTGAPPFDVVAGSAAEIERRIMKVPPAPLRAAAAKRGAGISTNQGAGRADRWSRQLDGDLDNIVQKALRKESDARYPSVEQFDDDLVRYLDRRPVRASGTGWTYRVRKFCERNAIPVALATIVVAVGTAGLTYILKQSDIIRLERDRAEATVEILKNAIQSSGTENPHSKNYSQARVMLAVAARDVDRLERTQPALFRDLAYQVGEIQINVGAYDEALALLQRANRLDSTPSKNGMLLELRALIMARRYQQARVFLEANRSRLASAPEFSHSEADLLIVERRPLEAMPICERFIRDPAVATNPLLLERFRMSLKEAYRSAGQLQNAMAVLDQIATERRRRYGEQHKSTEAALLWRVELLAEMEDYVSAERQLIAMKALVEEYNDDAMGDLTSYHDTYGKVLFGLDRPQEAIAHFRRALVAAGKGHGQGRAAAHFNLGIALSLGGADRREAYSHFWKAVEITERELGPASPNAGELRWQIGDAYLSDGDTAAARRAIAPAHALQYFQKMFESDRVEYMRVLRAAFGSPDCAPTPTPTPTPRARAASDSDRVANALLCRHGAEYSKPAID